MKSAFSKFARRPFRSARNGIARCSGLRFESLERRQLLTTLFVVDGGDAGAGTLREAVETANVDPTVHAIVIKSSVATIELDDSVEYTGQQFLSLRGRGTTIEPLAGQEGEFDLFVSSGGADLSIRDLVFQGGVDGIYVPVPGDATGTVSVSLKKVTVQDNAEFGIHVADQLNNSDASVHLNVEWSNFFGNGTGVLDRDGVRVDEGGLGSIHARVAHSHIDANGGDGLELDERGEGGVWMNVHRSTFDDNGFFNEADLDDGLDIDEADGGGVWAKLVDVSLSGNHDQGLDLDEEGEGSLTMWLTHVRANENLGEGIKADEEDEGSLFAHLWHVWANGSEEEEGIALEELGEGHLWASFFFVHASNNEAEGIDLAEEGAGNLHAFFSKVVTVDNDNDGIQIEEGDDGNLFAVEHRVLSTENSDYGMHVEQDDDGDDSGTLLVINSTLEPNDSGPLDTDGVTVV